MKENDALEEDELSAGEILLLYGYRPALLPWGGAMECSNEKADSAN